jgi:ParB-like nuclease domain
MKSQPATSLTSLGISKSESSRWQQVADVPADTRQQYVEETTTASREVSTDGLMRHDPVDDTDPAQLRRVTTTPERRVLHMEVSTDPRPASPPADLDSHPAADLFPLLEVESPEFGELVQDIREHGLLQPIVLCDGKILDGRNRYRACQHAGVEPRYEEWSGESPTAYVLSLNLHRRHLTHDARRRATGAAGGLFPAA